MLYPSNLVAQKLEFFKEEIVFEITEAGGKHFKQVKDADYQEDDDTYLISDAGNNRVMLITKTGEILWEWSTDLAFPYEADLLENGNVLISGTTSGAILEVSVEDSKKLFKDNECNINWLSEIF